jgi:hypothetical protein
VAATRCAPTKIRVFSEALDRTIRYRDAPTSEWNEKLRTAGLSEHVVHHLTVMTELHKQGRYDRMSEDYLKLTGKTPTSMRTSSSSMPRNSRGRHALVQGREVSMRKLRFSERQIAFIPTKAAAACPRGGTTCCPIVPEAPGLATGLNGHLS